MIVTVGFTLYISWVQFTVQFKTPTADKDPACIRITQRFVQFQEYSVFGFVALTSPFWKFVGGFSYRGIYGILIASFDNFLIEDTVRAMVGGLHFTIFERCLIP